MDCLNKEDIIANGGQVIENDNGTVSVYYGGDVLINTPLTKYCCELLDTTYTWDADKQLCKWGSGCDNSSPFKVVLNPIGNDGVIFAVDESNQETCTLDISFDYLFQMDCDDIISKIREINSNSELIELQTQYDNCISEVTRYEEELNHLILQLESTPYVIICDKTIKDEPIGPTKPTVRPTKYNSEISTREKLPVNFKPPHALLLFGLNQFCLTDAGLQQWEIILGAVRYQAWIISNGTDTNQYTCTDVAALDAIDNGTGDLFGTCDVSITARQEIISRIDQLRKLLLTFNCDDILAQINEIDTPCSSVSEILESLDVSMTLELINPDTGVLETIYEEQIFNIGSGNIATYLTTNQPNTGVLFSCNTTNENCSIIGRLLMSELAQLPASSTTEIEETETEETQTEALTELAQQSPPSSTTEIQELVQNSFNSEWLNFQTSITDQHILDLIYNEKIKISFKIKDCCVDFAILVDRIKMNRDCSKVDSVALSFTKSPSFEMVRTPDNKKSWMTNEDFKHREFDLKYRETQYDIDNYKLAINTKEVDLDINPANAIEQDLFCYVRDNLCLLECYTGNTSGVTGTTECCYVPPVTIECSVNYDFNQILSANTLSCDSSVTTACTVNSLWGIVITIGCDTIYSGTPFYSGTTILTAPTDNDYINELSEAAIELGLTFSVNNGIGVFTYTPNCNDSEYLQKCFNVELILDIDTNCEPTKQFQNGINFEFQDGVDYNFN